MLLAFAPALPLLELGLVHQGTPSDQPNMPHPPGIKAARHAIRGAWWCPDVDAPKPMEEENDDT